VSLPERNKNHCIFWEMSEREAGRMLYKGEEKVEKMI
jgi:hypothetical protein